MYKMQAWNARRKDGLIVCVGREGRMDKSF